MEVIQVPPAPKEAFNKHRPMSDLIKAQVKHFKHLEEKLSPGERQAIPQHRITSENDAALYIAAMTRLLRSSAGQAEAGPKTVTMQPKRSAKGSSTEVLAIAASAASAPKSGKQPKSKATTKKPKR